MLKSPFRSPHQIFCTYNEYGNTSFNDWYKANGVNIPFHNGIDCTFGNSRQTYGTECVCPFEFGVVVKVTWDSATSTKGNGVTIQGEVDGIMYQVVFWHTGEIKVKLGQSLKLGDVICYIGNTGLCSPLPTKENPWGGAHCHLMLFKYIKKPTSNGFAWSIVDYDNGVFGARNPRELFDFTQWHSGVDTGLGHDQWVLLQWVKDLSGQKLVTYLRDIIKFW